MAIPFQERKTSLRGMLDLLSGRYPAFLFGGGVSKILPVFHFHDVTASYLEPYLRYVKENGYNTVQSAEMAAFVRGKQSLPPRSVALTFDDAWLSLATVVAPLLQRYELKAVAYAVPTRIREEAGPFVSWTQLQALQRAGWIDVQAHSLSHAMIFCAPTPVDFIRPDRAPSALSLPLIREQGVDRFATLEDGGCPLYPMRSRLSDARRYLDDEEARARCLALVRQAGPDFFARPAWREELTRLVGPARGTYETEAERKTAIVRELAEARERLQARLGGETVRQICFPWAVCGTLAESELAALGYESAVADRLFGYRSVRPGDPPYRLMRLKHPYIYCLPGQGRRTFFTAKS